jgi:hypothetical protein
LVVEFLPNICEALGSIATIAKTNKNVFVCVCVCATDKTSTVEDLDLGHYEIKNDFPRP